MNIQLIVLIFAVTCFFYCLNVNATVENDQKYGETDYVGEGDSTEPEHVSSVPSGEVEYEVYEEEETAPEGVDNGDAAPVVEEADDPDEDEEMVSQFNSTGDERFGGLYFRKEEEQIDNEEGDPTTDELEERGRVFRCRKGPGHYCITGYPYGFIQCDAFGKGYFKRCPWRTKFHARYQVCVHMYTKIPYCYKHMTAWSPSRNPPSRPTCGRPLGRNQSGRFSSENVMGTETAVNQVSVNENDFTTNGFDEIDEVDSRGVVVDDTGFIEDYTENTRFKRSDDSENLQALDMDELDYSDEFGIANEEDHDDGSATRIVGGSIANIRKWPWQVSLRIGTTHVCGGVILNEKFILTAAHCFKQYKKPMYFKVYYGKSLKSTGEPGELIRNVEKILVHKRYNFPKNNNDIALVKLRDPIKFSYKAQPLCLPSRRNMLVPRGWPCIVTGYGATQGTGGENNLKEAVVPIIPLPVCKNIADKYKKRLTENMICAGYMEGKIDACRGDSGGPLACQDPRTKTYTLFGLVSFGWGCARERTPGVYAKVSNYLTWVTYNVKRHG